MWFTNQKKKELSDKSGKTPEIQNVQKTAFRFCNIKAVQKSDK